MIDNLTVFGFVALNEGEVRDPFVLPRMPERATRTLRPMQECQELRVRATLGLAVPGQPIHAIVPRHGLIDAVRHCRHRRAPRAGRA